MADVQYVTLYLPDGTGVSVVVGSQLYLTHLAAGATTSPPVFGTTTSTSPAAPDVRTPVATVWFHTPFGPQPITAPDIIDEYRRRDYAELTAAQAAAFYASGAEIPDVSYVTGVELPAAMATVAQGNNSFTAAQRAASVAAVEVAETVAPAGAWDFTQAPTVNGSPVAGSPPDASTTVKGIVELATTSETTTGTDTARAVSPAGVKAVADTKASLQAVAATVATSGALVVNKHNPVDATSAARTMALPAGQPEGAQVSVEKIDGSGNGVTISGSIRGVESSTVTIAGQYDSVVLRADSTGSWWPVAGRNPGNPVRVDEFTASTSGNAVPPNVAGCTVTLLGAGGGGGGGRRGAAATVRGGGGGGGSGGVVTAFVPTSLLAATFDITVGAGGTAGAAATGDDSNGGAGGNGGLSAFQSGAYRVQASNGNGGSGGTATGGTAGSNGGGTPGGSTGGTGSSTGLAGTAGGSNFNGGPAGGGGGGGITAADVAGAGGAGGQAFVVNGSTASGGVVGGAAPQNGAATVLGRPGSGAGGGAASTAGAAQAGAAALGYGAGGGGGGASLNGNASGVGGAGGAGYARVVWHFFG